MGSNMEGESCLAGQPIESAADKTRIQAAGNGNVRCPLYQCATIGEEGDRVVSALETQQELVEIYLSMGFQTALHLGKVDRPVMLMDLYRIPPAQGDLGTILSPQEGKIPLLANRALRLRPGRVDFS